MMEKINLIAAASALSAAWRSRTAGRVGNAHIKLLRMDASPHEEETHDYPEALLVLEGRLELAVGGRCQTIEAGEMTVVDAHQPHAVCPGSSGVLLIVDSA